jgi:hypothetical protein
VKACDLEKMLDDSNVTDKEKNALSEKSILEEKIIDEKNCAE